MFPGPGRLGLPGIWTPAFGWGGDNLNFGGQPGEFLMFPRSPALRAGERAVASVVAQLTAAGLPSSFSTNSFHSSDNSFSVFPVAFFHKSSV